LKFLSQIVKKLCRKLQVIRLRLFSYEMNSDILKEWIDWKHVIS